MDKYRARALWNICVHPNGEHYYIDTHLGAAALASDLPHEMDVTDNSSNRDEWPRIAKFLRAWADAIEDKGNI